MPIYLDSPALLTANQFEVLPQVGAVAEEAHFDDLHWTDLLPSNGRRGRYIRGVWLAGGRHAPPGQGAGVSWHHKRAHATLTAAATISLSLTEKTWWHGLELEAHKSWTRPSHQAFNFQHIFFISKWFSTLPLYSPVLHTTRHINFDSQSFKWS